jgi:hypothetical protein
MFLPVVRRSSDPDSHGGVDDKSAEGRLTRPIEVRPDQEEEDHDLDHVGVSGNEDDDDESDSGGGRDGEERSGGRDEEGREMWGSEKKKGKKKKKLLGLPAPGSGDGVGGSSSDMWGGEVMRRVGLGTRVTWVRTVKAVVLVVKVRRVRYFF